MIHALKFGVSVSFLTVTLFVLPLIAQNNPDPQVCNDPPDVFLEAPEEEAFNLLKATLPLMSPQEQEEAIWKYFMGDLQRLSRYELQRNLRDMFRFSKEVAGLDVYKTLIGRVLDLTPPDPKSDQDGYQRTLSMRTIAIGEAKNYEEFYPRLKTHLETYQPKELSLFLSATEMNEVRALLVAVSRDPNSSFIARDILEEKYTGPSIFYAGRDEKIKDLKEKEKVFLDEANEFFRKAKESNNPKQRLALNMEGNAAQHKARLLEMEHENFARQNEMFKRSFQAHLKVSHFSSDIVESLGHDASQKAYVENYLTHENPSYRVGAIRGLAHHPQNWSKLRGYLDDKDSNIQRVSVLALKNDEDAWPKIVGHLNHEDPNVKEAVTSAFYETSLKSEMYPYFKPMLQASFRQKDSFDADRQRWMVYQRVRSVTENWDALSDTQKSEFRSIAKELKPVVQGNDVILRLLQQTLNKTQEN